MRGSPGPGLRVLDTGRFEAQAAPGESPGPDSSSLLTVTSPLLEQPHPSQPWCQLRGGLTQKTQVAEKSKTIPGIRCTFDMCQTGRRFSVSQTSLKFNNKQQAPLEPKPYCAHADRHRRTSCSGTSHPIPCRDSLVSVPLMFPAPGKAASLQFLAFSKFDINGKS